MALIACWNRKHKLPGLNSDSEDIEAGILLNNGTSPTLAPTPCKTTQDPSQDPLQDKLHQEPDKVNFEDEHKELTQRKVRKPLPPIRGMFQGPLY